MMLRRCVVLVVACALPGLACAANWVRAAGGGSEDGYVAYVDAATVLPSERYMKAWTKRVYKSPQDLQGRSYRSVVALEVHDCLGHRSSVRKILYYADAAATQPVDTLTFREDDFQDAIPGSISEMVLAKACQLYLHELTKP